MRFLARGLIAVALLAAALPAQAAGRAIWVWERETYAMLEKRDEADAAIAFLAAKNIDCVYLYADAYGGRNVLAQNPRAYTELIQRLRAKGIRAYALLGSWHLHTEEWTLPSRHVDAAASLRKVLEYNARAPKGGRFAGVNLDIEPHLLDAWNDQSKPELLRNFLDLGRLLMALKRELHAEIPMGPAIPFWLDGIRLEWGGTVKPVSEHVLDTWDYVALMDYRDHADGRNGVIALARSEMDYASSRGKRLAIGIDISPGEPESVSFDHLREPDLERTLSATEQAFGGIPAFDGFVLHHFRAYRDWLARQAK